MGLVARARSWLSRTGLEILGWILVPLGIVMMPAPGPGTLVLLGGIALLARTYTWAERALDWLEDRAIEAARFGVATWPRIVLSALGCVWLGVLGAIWWIGPDIPELSLPTVTVSAVLVKVGFWALVVLLSVLAVIVLRGLLRARDAVRTAIVAAVWAGGLWWATLHTPFLGRATIDVTIGPELPGAGPFVACSIWAGGLLAVGLLIFSIVKWREPAARAHEEKVEH